MSSLTTAKYLDISEAAGSRKEKKNCQMAESKTELYNLTKKIDLTKFMISSRVTSLEKLSSAEFSGQ